MNTGSNTNVALVAGHNANIDANNLSAMNDANIAIIAGASHDTTSQIARSAINPTVPERASSPPLTERQVRLQPGRIIYIRY